MARKVEKDRVFGVVLDQVRDVRCAQKGKPKLVLCIAGLRLPLRPDGERSGIQRTVPARPEEGAMGLVGFKIAEIAETTAAKPATPSTTAAAAPSASEATASSAKATSTSPKASAATGATAWPPPATLSAASLTTATGKRLIQLSVVAKLLHVHSGEGVGRACLAGNGDRFGGEIRIIG